MCVCVSLYLPYTVHQNMHFISKMRTFLLILTATKAQGTSHVNNIPTGF